MGSAKRMKDKEPRHVRLYHWLMQTDAWQDLDCVARCAYLELASRYGGPGSNNGSIPCSVREIALALSVGKTTAQRALTSLQEHGFIVMTKAGGFNVKHRHAAEWLLTEFRDDRPNGAALPLKTFARWQKSKHGSVSGTERYLTRDVSVPHTGQSQKETMAYGSASGTVSQNDGSVSGTLLVYQGEAAFSAPTEGAPLAKEAPSPKGRARRSEQAGGVVVDLAKRIDEPVTVSEALKRTLEKAGRASR